MRAVALSGVLIVASWSYEVLAQGHDAELAQAVKVSNEPDIRRLLDAGRNVNAKADVKSGYTMLHVARNEAIARLLIERGARVDARDANGSTPLNHFTRIITYTVDATSRQQHELIIHLLIQSGADVNAMDNQGNTPLHFAVGRKIIRLLLDAGAKPTIVNKRGESPIYNAVELYNHRRRKDPKYDYKSFELLSAPFRAGASTKMESVAVYIADREDKGIAAAVEATLSAKGYKVLSLVGYPQACGDYESWDNKVCAQAILNSPGRDLSLSKAVLVKTLFQTETAMVTEYTSPPGVPPRYGTKTGPVKETFITKGTTSLTLVDLNMQAILTKKTLKMKRDMSDGPKWYQLGQGGEYPLYFNESLKEFRLRLVSCALAKEMPER